MHQLFAALMALLLSFGHHASLRPTATVVYTPVRPSHVLFFPDRHSLAQATAEASYAGPHASPARR